VGLEAVQLVIPGSHPSLADILFNTLGTALAIALAYIPLRPRVVAAWSRCRRYPHDGRALGATSVFALTGALLAPSFPEDTYYGGWTPRFAHLEWYGGRVLEASLDLRSTAALSRSRVGIPTTV
jgi:hypothetical protein